MESGYKIVRAGVQTRSKMRKSKRCEKASGKVGAGLWNISFMAGSMQMPQRLQRNIRVSGRQEIYMMRFLEFGVNIPVPQEIGRASCRERC